MKSKNNTPQDSLSFGDAEYTFTDMAKEEVVFDEDEFADDIFDALDNEDGPKHGRKKWNIHIIFFILAACVLLFAVVRLVIWNMGEDSGYDPTADTSEFDTEPLDYIQPLNSTQLADKPIDDKTTILCLGNSTFADNGSENPFACALAETMDATVLNAGFADSFQSQKNAEYTVSYPEDGISLYQVTKALTTGDFSIVDEAAAAVSPAAVVKAEEIKEFDMSSVDMILIMYDISDYIEKRPAYDPGNPDNLLTYCGTLSSSIKLIQEKYPYIRIVVLSTPACGKTVDDYYVDGNIHDLGNGTLTDYMGHEVNVAVTNGVSYIDTFFGVINVENRDQYLYDDYHINEAGGKALAERVAKLIVLNE